MPEPETIQLPLKPAGNSLASHVAALDLLAARVASLPTRSRWPARVPINSKASFNGHVVHTDEVKAYIAKDEWVEMSAREAASHIRGRKLALLEDQARISERQKPVSLKPKLEEGQRVIKTKDIKFDPVLAHPGSLPRFIPQRVEESGTLAKTAQLVQSDDLPESLQSLVDLVGEHFKDKLTMPNAEEDDVVDADGLPIHEIRESLEGDTLGPAPEPSGDGEVTFEEKDDYWSPEAVARRQALRNRLFHEDVESDEDDDMAVDEEEKQPAPEKPEAKSSSAMDVDSAVQPPSTNVTPPTPTTIKTPQPQSAHLSATPSSPTSALSVSSPALRSPGTVPKSILKAPTRKKSVTFGAGTKLPADPLPSSAAQKLGFATSDLSTEVPTKGVPIIPPPTPGKGYGGLRPGFLSSPAPKAAPLSSPKIEVLDDDEKMEEEPKKKTSLFAQRRAEKPSLPKISDSKPMAAMKTSVVEKPIATPPAGNGSRATTVPPTVGSTSAPASTPLVVVDNESDPDDYGDLGEFSDDEEDEYALDEALLAREVALEYHRRQAWQRPTDEDEVDPEDPAHAAVMGIPRVSSVTGGTEADPLRIVNPTPDDLSQFLRVGRDADGQLVFEQPLVDSGSESEGEGEESEEKRQRRARRQETMRRLLAGDYEDLPAEGSAEAERKDREAKWAETVPPAVGASVAPVETAGGDKASQPSTEAQPSKEPQPSRPQPASASPASTVPAKHGRAERDEVERVALPETPAADAPAPPKKISRFKAARQGL